MLTRKDTITHHDSHRFLALVLERKIDVVHIRKLDGVLLCLSQEFHHFLFGFSRESQAVNSREVKTCRGFLGIFCINIEDTSHAKRCRCSKKGGNCLNRFHNFPLLLHVDVENCLTDTRLNAHGIEASLKTGTNFVCALHETCVTVNAITQDIKNLN